MDIHFANWVGRYRLVVTETLLEAQARARSPLDAEG
jgi:hypothetical protein